MHVIPQYTDTVLNTAKTTGIPPEHSTLWLCLSSAVGAYLTRANSTRIWCFRAFSRRRVPVPARTGPQPGLRPPLAASALPLRYSRSARKECREPLRLDPHSLGTSRSRENQSDSPLAGEDRLGVSEQFPAGSLDNDFLPGGASR